MAEPKGQKPKVTDDRPAARESVAEARTQSGVGATLRTARLAAGIDLHKAAESLRIRYPYLEAIEAGRFGDLPGPTYALGFVRAYAEFLGLDGKQMVRQFKEEGQGLSRRITLIFPEPVQEGRFPGGVVLVFAVILAAAVYSGWYYWEHREVRGAGEVPSVPTNLAALVTAKPKAAQQSPASVPATESQARIEENTANAPAPTTLGSSRPSATPTKEPTTATGGASAIIVAPPPTVAPPSQPASAPPAAAAPVSETKPTEAETSAEPVSPADTASAVAGPPAAAGEPAGSSAPEQAAALPPTETHVHGNANADSRITLNAKLDSWVEVRDASGKVLWTRLLRAGDSYRVPNLPGLALLTGNAGGLEIIIDGKPAPALGPVGVVRRNIRLDPDKLAAGASARR